MAAPSEHIPQPLLSALISTAILSTATKEHQDLTKALLSNLQPVVSLLFTAVELDFITATGKLFTIMPYIA